MELTSVKVIKNLLKEYKATPLKGLGQNFLIDKSVLKKIIESANLNSKDIVLEIGPGIGTLTQELAKKARKVIAIEKDRNLVRILNNELRIMKIENVEIIQGDILRIPNSQFLIPNSYKVVANLPYYIVAPVIRKFLESTEARPPQMVLMVQKEVAQRICAKPPDMSILAVSVQFYAKPEILFYVSKNSFWPQPKVDGAIIKIILKKPGGERVSPSFCNLFFKIVKAGFSHPRKQLVNNFSKVLKLDKEKIKDWLLKSGVAPTQRAETLTIEDWIKLTKTYIIN